MLSSLVAARLSRALMLAWLLGALLLLVLHTAHGAATRAASPQSRAEDPVMVAGALLAELQGAPLDELRLYRYGVSTWAPVPFQVDERDVTGTYVVFEDGLLDANDELVFMGKDVGQAAGEQWPEDASASAGPRYQLAVSDPLEPGTTGWLYLFRSATLATTDTRYVTWDQAAQTVSAHAYTATFSQSFVGLADLALNGAPTDVLDRQKFRATALGGIIRLNEETLAQVLTPTVSIPVVGPVRGVGNGSAFDLALYGARLDFFVRFDTSGIGLELDSLRTSLDLRDPAVTGINRYFDSNGSNVPIDGAPDPVPATPIEWYQASGSPGGLFVTFPTVNTGGTVSTYYRDSASLDPQDTGDQRSFGDTGLAVQAPDPLIEVALAAYVLPPGTTGNVGASYLARLEAPLVATATAQHVQRQLFLPLVARP